VLVFARGRPTINLVQPTVLIVDDDRELSEVLADALAELGYRVECVHDGFLAMERLGKGPLPAAIILDLLMPRMDGLEFLRSRRGDDRMEEIPVIVLTGERAMTRRARELAGVVLEKPVKLLMLVEAIQTALERPAQRADA
jgi:CheY-like chemotaxis protein